MGQPCRSEQTNAQGSRRDAQLADEESDQTAAGHRLSAELEAVADAEAHEQRIDDRMRVNRAPDGFDAVIEE